MLRIQFLSVRSFVGSLDALQITCLCDRHYF